MGLISSGIDCVRAFELPSGIWSDGGVFAEPRVALIRWRSQWHDKYYQVYVNRLYAGTTLDFEQRQLVVQVPGSVESVVRIEVFAVESADADFDFSSELESFYGESGRVKIRLLRDQNLPVGSTVQIYFNNGSGEIDYDAALTGSGIEVWSCWQDKCGFGMSMFGLSDFGLDSAAAVGFGKGCFGGGGFGLDADAIEWVSERLPDGVYKFGVKVIDAEGNESVVSETNEITVIEAARPAECVGVFSFDKNTNNLVLSVA